ncbi:MAG: hypothetical protein ACREJ5_04920 [Geminicoccaceae bacterium]
MTLGLDRRRQRERAAERPAREAMATFEQDGRAPLRSSLQDLEKLSARILEAAGRTTASERQSAAKVRITRRQFSQRPTGHWRAQDIGRAMGINVYIARLRDLELQMDNTLRELAGGDFTTTHGISGSSRRLADLVREFSIACRLWLYEISEAVSSGKLRPPPRRS